MIDALVLAGSHNNGSLQNISHEKYEALIKIGGTSMLSYVLRALQNCSGIDRIVVIGPEAIQEFLPPEVHWLESADTMMENIQRGSAVMKGPYLITTSDIPLLTPQAINGFLALCKDCQEDFYFPLISKQLVERDYPGSKRTYIHFKEDVYTGGNVFLVNPQVVESCIGIGQELINLRKDPLALARRVGVSLLLKLLLHRLSVQEVQQRASGLLGIRGRAVICPYPEIGIDVDKPADFALISSVLGYDLPGKIAANAI